MQFLEGSLVFSPLVFSLRCWLAHDVRLRGVMGVLLGLSVLLGALGAAPLEAQTLGYSQGHGQLFRVDLDSGVATPVGEANGAFVASLNFGADGALYGIFDSRTLGVPLHHTALGRLDTSSGAISDLVILDAALSDFTIDSAGRMWALVDDVLSRLDPQTGARSGAVTLARFPLALVSRGLDLFVFSLGDTGTLLLERVDGETGRLTTLGEVFGGSDGSVTASAFDAAGRLRFFEAPGGITTVAGFVYQRMDDVTAPSPVTTATASYSFAQGEAGMRSLALRGADSVSVPLLGSPGLMVLIFSLLIAALCVLRRSSPPVTRRDDRSEWPRAWGRSA